MTRVVVVTPEPLAERMAGPAIRALELGRAVAASGHSVDVVSLTRVERSDPDVRVGVADEADLGRLVGAADVVVLQGDVLGLQPWLAEVDVPIVVDAYDPFHLEQLEQARPLGEARRRAVVRDCVRALSVQLARADLVLCAAGPQRALWLGHLAALGRVNPVTYDADPTLGGLLAVVPFGVPSAFPPVDGAVLKGVVPGIGPDDLVLLWGGGIYPWFDAETLVRAMVEVERRVPTARLVFLGGGHPVLGSAGDAARTAARRTAESLGLLGRSVFFHKEWVPYDERHRWLAEADVGVSTHHLHVETEFAFRTRCLDYLWAGLPVVTSGGDAIAELVAAGDLGAVVEPGAVAELAEQLAGLLSDPERRAACGRRSAEAGARFRWSEVARPLVDFCAAPRRAPDLVLPAGERALLGVGDPGRVGGSSGVAARLSATWREGGPSLLARRLTNRVRGLAARIRRR